MTMMSSRQEPSVKVVVMLSPRERSMLKNDQVDGIALLPARYRYY